MTPRFLIVDLFCGAGGTTTGFDMTGGMAKVIACVNHDAKAIKSHWLNHPDVTHFEEDIRTLKLQPLIKLVKKWQAQYPDAILILWASLECTNFSKAKGGLPRDADSRTLADHLHRYITAINPDLIQIENVVEFMSWGPLDKNGKPVSKKAGTDWMRWRKEVCAHGYVDEWRELNSADYGAYTSRNRLFGMFSRDSSYIAWPEPTHSKNPSAGKMFAAPNKWRAVKEVLDLQDDGKTIFRDKPLSDKTLARIYAGLIKYVAGGKDMFIQKYYSGRPAGKVIAVDGPAGTITTADGQSVVKAEFLLKYNSMNRAGNHIPPSLNEPCPVVAAQPRLGTVFLTKYYGKGTNAVSIEDPAATLGTKDTLAKIEAQWLDKPYTSGNHNHQSIEQPAGSITSVPKFNKVSAQWLDKQYSGDANHQSIENPAGSILANDKHCKINADRFIMNTNYNNTGAPLDTPCPTITASRRHHYLVNPSWGGNPGDVDQPSPVIIARQDKAPLYLVAIESGNIAIAVYESDSEIMLKIKEFMVLYDIVDIKMRMLKVSELLKIQGFPNDYKLEGNQTDQKKFIGNSVVPLVVKCWIEAINLNLRIAA